MIPNIPDESGLHAPKIRSRLNIAHAGRHSAIPYQAVSSLSRPEAWPPRPATAQSWPDSCPPSLYLAGASFSSSFQASTQPPSAPLAACKPLDLLVPWLRLSLLIASHAKHAVGKESLLLALLSAGAHPVKGPAVWPPSLPFPSPPLSSNRGRPGRLWRTSTAALEIRSGRARRRQGNEIFIVCESHRRRRGQKKNDPCAV